MDRKARWVVDYGNREKHGVADSVADAMRMVGDCLSRRVCACSITVAHGMTCVWYWEMPNDWDMYAPALIGVSNV